MLRNIQIRCVNMMLGASVDLPAYATAGSAGLDLRACIDDDVILEPGGRKLIKTGVAVNMQDPNIVAIVASRSGLSLKHGIRVAQGVGVIDSDYQEEIGVILANDSDMPYTIKKGDRIAQLMFQPVIQVELNVVDHFSTATDRKGGFGSTGTN